MKQTLLCTYLSAVLLAGLALNSLFGWSWADPIAAGHRRGRGQGAPGNLAWRRLLRREPRLGRVRCLHGRLLPAPRENTP
ncbi:hypothetical protein ACTMTI_43045 [Nonomuraea sp. H19]|uniref:hypothetical protein n=1 Tax=Nonomuraea sp. H19 TaxID=3452206 RepID=UPI003F8CCA9B